MILELINISSLITLIMLGWFRTMILMEYADLFNIQWLQKLLKLKEYRKELSNDVRLSYFDFLVLRHYGYWSKMLSCPICFSVWVSVIISFIFGYILYFPVINVVALTFYYIITWK